MNHILSMSFLVQFGVSGIVLCSTVFLLSVVRRIATRVPVHSQHFCSISQKNPTDNLIEYIAVVLYLICVISQILLNGFLGSRLTDQSDDITHAIYSSQWMDRNEKCKRAMCILIVRGMRPIRIFAGGLFELSLPTFVKVELDLLFPLNRYILLIVISRYAKPPIPISICSVNYTQSISEAETRCLAPLSGDVENSNLDKNS